MKKLLFFSIAFCLTALAQAQKVYFIYIQSENGTPFYVRMGEKVSSSTAEGYLILPKLKDSTYLFSLGQPGKQGEFQFSININKSDRGFIIKNGDNTVNLFDLQSTSLYKPASNPTSAATKTTLRTDNFSKILARAAGDTSLLTEVVYVQQAAPQKEAITQAVVKEEVKPIDTTTASSSVAVSTPKIDSMPATTVASNTTSATDTASTAMSEKNPDTSSIAITKPPTTNAGNTTTTAVSPEVKDTLAKMETKVAEPLAVSEKTEERKEATATVAEEEFKRSTIVKKSESSTSDGFGLVYIDSYDGQTDTIQLTIPNPLFVLDTTQRQAESKEFLDITNQTSFLAKSENKNQSATKEKKKPVCTTQADDDDFFKLRRDMASKKRDDDMIDQARKYFKGKCFRSEQIKYLSTLFLTDNGKYNFFDAAYLHVSDQDKFKTLESEIKDAYYVNRFKALIAN